MQQPPPDHEGGAHHMLHRHRTGSEVEVVMLRSRSQGWLTLAIASAALAACDSNEITAPAAHTARGTTARQYQNQRPSEQPQLALAKSLPGFGGYYFDSNGNLHGVMTDLSRRDEAIALLRPILRDRPSRRSRAPIATPEVVLHLGRFSFSELAAWRDQARHIVTGIPGFVFLDADQVRNRVTIAVTNESSRKLVTGAIRRSGIPLDAVEVIVRAPFVEGAGGASSSSGHNFSMMAGQSLSDTVRPLVGGLLIGTPGNTSGSVRYCTLGFSAYTSSNVPVFLTNSHCVGAIGSYWSQPTYNWSSPSTLRIGSVYLNPTWQTPMSDASCPDDPSPYLCRWSDAALVRYTGAAATNFLFGALARTTYYGTGAYQSGSEQFDPSNPYWFITTEAQFPAIGDKLHKVGSASGWTWGTVTEDCVDFAVRTTNKYLYCQDIVSDAFFGTGDSGAPVFLVTGTGTNSYVTLVGVAWGGDYSGGMVMSAMANIEYELGALQTF
jgi:hypothetical protein